MNKDKAIILCGMPNAGKGDLSNLLKKLPNFVYISTGDLCRSADPKTPLGRKVLDIMHKGILIDDDIINEMVDQKIKQIKQGSNLVFDGYPRRISQAKLLLKKLEDLDFDTMVIFLEVDEEVSILRRDKRINDFRKLGQEPRKDDLDLAALSKRFLEYRENTVPMVEFLRRKLEHKFYSIESNYKTIDPVYSIVKDILEIKNVS